MPHQDSLARLNMDENDLPFTFYRGAGCANCNDTGFRGRTVIEEMMIIGPKIRELIQSSATADTLREAAMAMGTTTLGMSGMKKIEMGITTIEEVLKAVHEKEELTTVCPHCAKTVSLDFKDCPYCNNPIIPTCNACKRILQPDWIVCPYCGNSLKSKS